MFTDEITSRLSIFTTGDINAWGPKVVSDEYSYPISTILTFLILPIVFDEAFIFASVPLTLFTFLNCGNFF